MVTVRRVGIPGVVFTLENVTIQLDGYGGSKAMNMRQKVIVVLTPSLGEQSST